MAKKELSEQEKETIKLDTYLNYMFYSDELLNRTDKEDEIQERETSLKERIQGFNNNELYAKKEQILEHDHFISTVSRVLTDETELDEERLNEIVKDYNRVNAFFNNEGDNAFKILDEYNGIVSKDSEGYYQINDTIINKVIKDNNFYISDKEDKDALKNKLFDTWENQQELITQETLDKNSTEQNGINFKHFVFCEEYIKRGKIKPTCDHLGISRNTAYLWLKDENVQAYLKSRKEEIKQETDNTFLDTYTACFNELNSIIKGYSEQSDKIKAIDVFLKHYENLERLKQPTYED